MNYLPIIAFIAIILVIYSIYAYLRHTALLRFTWKPNTPTEENLAEYFAEVLYVNGKLLERKAMFGIIRDPRRCSEWTVLFKDMDDNEKLVTFRFQNKIMLKLQKENLPKIAIYHATTFIQDPESMRHRLIRIKGTYFYGTLISFTRL